MYGIFKFISFVCIYYIIASFVDIYGTYRGIRSEIVSQDQTASKFELSSNLDLFVISIIYLASYYYGLFDA
jgi:CHASE3 domain sensor protein